jgi:hypothetical protein
MADSLPLYIVHVDVNLKNTFTIHTHTHITKQYKTTTVQIKTDSTRSTQMKYNTHNITTTIQKITTIQKTKSTTITHKTT